MVVKTPIFMGIINVTPDSFSDGGKFFDSRRATEHGLRLAAEGAGILDIGGESSRPGATPLSAAEEIKRILPVIEGLRACGVVISVDTYHYETTRAALGAGAGMVNDITALRNPENLEMVAASRARACLMHMQGMPATMQDCPVYADVVAEVYDFLQARLTACEAAGVARENLMIDPGIGFGKTLAHNLTLLKNLSRFTALEVPILIGVSRKGFIAKFGQGEADRLPGSIAAALWAWQQGASIFRVHDVAATAAGICRASGDFGQRVRQAKRRREFNKPVFLDVETRNAPRKFIPSGIWLEIMQVAVLNTVDSVFV